MSSSTVLPRCSANSLTDILSLALTSSCFSSRTANRSIDRCSGAAFGSLSSSPLRTTSSSVAWRNTTAARSRSVSVGLPPDSESSNSLTRVSTRFKLEFKRSSTSSTVIEAKSGALRGASQGAMGGDSGFEPKALAAFGDPLGRDLRRASLRFHEQHPGGDPIKVALHLRGRGRALGEFDDAYRRFEGGDSTGFGRGANAPM